MPTPTYVFSDVCETPEESGDFGEGLDRSYVRNFEAFLDPALSTSADISVLQVWEQEYNRLPRYGDIWTSRDGSRSDALSVMRKFSGRRDRQDKHKFRFTFNYSPKGNEAQRRNIGGGTDDLANLWPEWTLTSEERLWPTETGKDLDNKKVVNSAGDPYDPMPMKHEPVIVLDYDRIEKSLTNMTDDELANEVDYYAYKTNSDEFIFADDEKKWLCTMFKLVPTTVGPYRVIRRQMQFKYFLRAGILTCWMLACTR